METAALFQYATIAKELARKQKLVEKTLQEIVDQKTKLREVLNKEYRADLSKEEQNFLNLVVCPEDGNYSNRKTVFDTIIDNCIGEMSDGSEEAELIVNEIFVRITSSELNNNGFYYDSGRGKIRSTLCSVFEKLLIWVSFETFDYNDEYVFAFRTQPSRLV